MAGYIRQSVADIINGANITAPPLNAEFNQLASAFNGTTGHTHDGSTGQGPKINLAGSVSGYLLAANGGVGGRNNNTASSDPTATSDVNSGYAPGSIWLNTATGRLYICIVNAANAAIWVQAVGVANGNVIVPEFTATVDLGSSTYKFKNLYLSGGIDVDTIVSSGVSTDTLSVATTSTFTGLATFNGGATVNGISTLNGNVTVNGNTQLGDATTDTINAVGRFNSSLLPSTDDARDLGSVTNEWRDLYVDGTANIDSLIADTADINGGTIDGAAIGGVSPSTGNFTSVSIQTLSVTGNTTIGDSTADSVALNAEVTTSIVPKSDDAVDLGSSTKEFRNLFIDGQAQIDNLVADTADINAGSIDNAVIGGTTPAAATVTTLNVNTSATIASADINAGTIDGTVIGGSVPQPITGTQVTATTGFVGNVTGNVAGNVVGNVTGDLTGNVTGNVSGNITSGGTSTFQDVQINGSLNMNAGTTGTITGLSTPVNPSDAATKNYVDTEIAAVIDAAPGALDTLNELAAALGDDSNFATSVYNTIATKLPLAGGTMTGNIAMSSNKITDLATPTAGADASNKAYVDTQDALKVSKAGDTMSGDLNMDGSFITNVSTPFFPGDAANKGYVDSILGSATASADSAAAAATSEANAAQSAFDAALDRQLAQDWAIKTSGTVDGTNYSSKYWATQEGVLTVSSNIASVNTTSSNIADVNTVAGVISDVSTVSSISSDVSNVSSISGAVSNVSGISANVTTVAGAAGVVGVVANDIANVNVVSTNIAAVNTVANDMASVLTAAADLNEAVSEIDTVANSIANVDIVGTNIGNVNTVGNAIGAVNTVSTNIAAVGNVSSIASDVSIVAGIASDVTTAAQNVVDFNNRYLGPQATAPTIDPNGSALDVGDLYFDTASQTMKVYTSSGWAAAGSSVNGTANRYSFTVGTSSGSYTGSTTVFPATYDAGFLDVYLNGVKLSATDFTATNGTSITLGSAAASGDLLEIIAYGTFTLANVSLNTLTNVNTSGYTPKEGQILSYNSTAAVYEPQDFIKRNLPTTRPSLNLDFANTKQLDPRITFRRASTATYYDGETVAKAEENFLKYSQEFDNSYWIKASSTVTANSTTAPDGTSTADTLSGFNGAISYFSIGSSDRPTTYGVPYVFSVFAKANTETWLWLEIYDSANKNAFFDLSGGVVGTTASGVTASITSVGNGWYRCSITVIPTSGCTPNIGVADGDNDRILSGNDSIYVWGAQLEQRSTATAYTATTTRPVTKYIPVLQTAGGNMARFDHDPVTGESKGLLIEKQRTNLLTYSEKLDNAVWAKTRTSITANTIVAPDGTLTGDKLVEDTTAASSHSVQASSVSVSSGTTYTLSVYLKAGGRNYSLVRMGNVSSTTEWGSTPYAYFDLSNGTVATTGGAVTASVIDVGNGWYRCSITATTIASGTTRPNIFSNETANANYDGDGYSGIYIWGAQLEVGQYPSSYIKTIDTQATRAGDLAYIDGLEEKNLINLQNMTVYAEYDTPYNPAFGERLVVFGASSTPISWNIEGYRAEVFNGSSYTLAGPNIPATRSGKIAVRIRNTGDFSMCFGGAGGLGSEINSYLFHKPTYVHFGGYGKNTANLDGTVKKISFYLNDLSDTEMQEITEA